MVGSLLLHLSGLWAVVYTIFHRDVVVNMNSFLQGCGVTLGIHLWRRGQEEIVAGASTCLFPSYHSSIYFISEGLLLFSEIGEKTKTGLTVLLDPLGKKN